MIAANERTSVPTSVAVCPWCGGQLNVQPIDWVQPFVGIDFYIPGDGFALECEFQDVVYHHLASDTHFAIYKSVAHWLKCQLIVTEFGPENPMEHL